MKIGILACSVFEPELKKVLSDIENKKLFEDNIEVTYLHFGLHTNLDKLEKDVTDSLDKLTLEYDKVIVLYGSKCHYRFFEFLKKYDNIVTCRIILFNIRFFWTYNNFSYFLNHPSNSIFPFCIWPLFG